MGLSSSANLWSSSFPLRADEELCEFRLGKGIWESTREAVAKGKAAFGEIFWRFRGEGFEKCAESNVSLCRGEIFRTPKQLGFGGSDLKFN
jgi:hypothetical protein